MPDTQPTSPGEIRCVRCSVALAAKWAFRLGSGDQAVWKCMRCSFIDGKLMVRSAKVALVVGSLLVALNQGDQLLAGTFPWSGSWYKIPLTYFVPFCVATYGALANGYRGSASA